MLGREVKSVEFFKKSLLVLIGLTQKPKTLKDHKDLFGSEMTSGVIIKYSMMT